MDWRKKFEPAQNILGPVKGQGISVCFFTLQNQLKLVYGLFGQSYMHSTLFAPNQPERNRMYITLMPCSSTCPKKVHAGPNVLCQTKRWFAFIKFHCNLEMSFCCLKSSKKNKEIFPGFLPQPLKRGQIKKVRAIGRILFWLPCNTFLIWLLFRG